MGALAGAGDSINSLGSQAFLDKNFGIANKTVRASGVTIKDASNTNVTNNYNISYVDNTSSTINKANLSKVTASKTYDGSYTVTFDQLSSIEGVHNETFFATAGVAYISDKNVSTPNKTITNLSGLSLASANGGLTNNYNWSTGLPAAGPNNSVSIAKAAISVSLVGSTTKTYDGLTSGSLFQENFLLSGFVRGESAAVGPTQATYADPNVSNNTTNSKGLITATLNHSDFTAVGSTDLDNYALPTSAAGSIGVITPAPLTIKVNNTSAFVTQDVRNAPDQGFSYEGLKNGEAANTALNGSPTRTYNNGNNNTPVAGTYVGVFGVNSIPTAVNGNYTISVTNGDLVVVPADKLLITIGSQVASYGNRTSTNAGLASSGTVSAQYCLDPNASCTGANLASLNVTHISGTQWKATDNTNSYVVFDTALVGANYSTGGYLNVGNYTYTTSEIVPLSLPNGNFKGRATNGGVLTISPKSTRVIAASTTKTYDGTASVLGADFTTTGVLLGDDVNVTFSSGAFSTLNADNSIGFSVSGLNLTGNDMRNYSLINHSTTGIGSITAKTVSLSGAIVANKVYDGTTNGTLLNKGNLVGLVNNESLTLSNETATFSTPNIGVNKTVYVTASLANGTGLARNYALSGGTAYADINAANNPNGLKPYYIRPPKPILPTDNNRNDGPSEGGTTNMSPSNPYSIQTNQRKQAERCNSNNLEACDCEEQSNSTIASISICFQPIQHTTPTSNNPPKTMTKNYKN